MLPDCAVLFSLPNSCIQCRRGVPPRLIRNLEKLINAAGRRVYFTPIDRVNGRGLSYQRKNPMISRREFLITAAGVGSSVITPFVSSHSAVFDRTDDLIRTAPRARFWLSTASSDTNCLQCHKPDDSGGSCSFPEKCSSFLHFGQQMGSELLVSIPS